MWSLCKYRVAIQNGMVVALFAKFDSRDQTEDAARRCRAKKLECGETGP